MFTAHHLDNILPADTVLHGVETLDQIITSTEIVQSTIFEMGCGACGPTRDIGTERMYKELEKKVLAQEEEKKQAERDRRISLGLPAEEGEIYSSSQSCYYSQMQETLLQCSASRWFSGKS